MRRPKLVFSSGGFIFYHSLFCCCTIDVFPHYPRVLGDVEFLPVLVGLGGLLRAEHHICRNDDECRICDRVVCPFGLGLDVFKFFNISWDALDINMIALHLVL